MANQALEDYMAIQGLPEEERTKLREELESKGEATHASSRFVSVKAVATPTVRKKSSE